MSKLNIAKRLALLLSLLMVFTASVFPTLAYVITQTHSVVNTFLPTTYPVGQLTLSKAVEHSLGLDYIIPDAIEFLFDITLGEEYAGKKLTTDSGDELIADSNGNVSVSVKPGSSLTLNDIFEGTDVKITEHQTLPGFTVKDGEVTKNAVIVADSVVNVDYINVYAPANAENTVTLKGEKILQGRPWQDGDKFTFLLEYHDGESWISLGTQSVEFDPDDANFNKFDFTAQLSDVAFDAVGVYAFRMTEQEGTDETIAYDSTVNYFNITVADHNMDGKFEISSVVASENATASENEANGTYSVNVVFNNTYEFTPPQPPVEGSASSRITVKKTVKNVGAEAIGPENFEFVLENIDSGDKITLKTDKNGLAVFDLLYTEEDIGTHNYKLYEVNTGLADVTYSEKVYDVTITVSRNEDGIMSADVLVDGEKTGDAVAVFENIYDKEVVIPPTGDTLLIVLVALFAVSALAIRFIKRKRA